MEEVKHIITSGCSFTRQEKRLGFNCIDDDFITDSDKFWRWPHHIQKKYTNYKVYNLGNPTNDNSIITQSTIKKITDLLNDGISPSDIKVLIQWSEQNRNSFFISNEVAKSYEMMAKERTQNYINHFDIDFNKWAHLSAFAEKDHFDKQWGYYLLTGGYIVDHIHYPQDLIKIHAKYFSHQESSIRFFTNIILIQNFCKINNIEDLFMFNLSYNFITDIEPDYYHTMEQVYLKKELPEFNINFKSENPYISYLYQNIDFSKFWFYNNQYTNVGGQLEWAISEFDYKVDNRLFMEHTSVGLNLENFCKIPPEFGGCTGHVSSEMNQKFVNNILKDFLEK